MMGALAGDGQVDMALVLEGTTTMYASLVMSALRDFDA